jgi:murein DD-endopeptidase MepM/ murein hydrolase activator NlpD
VTSPHRSVRGARRLTSAPLLVGAAVFALCTGGAAVATAQTPLSTSGDTTTSTTTTTGETTPDTTTTTGETTTTPDTTTTGDDTLRARDDARLVLENVKPGKIFTGGIRKADFAFETAGATADLKIEAVKRSSGEVAKTWNRNGVQPGDRQHVTWNGTKDGGGKAKGRYFFRVSEAGGQQLNRKRADGKREVRVYPAIFPVRGRHQYWDGFGAGRNHQGQDVGAACGTRLVAAQAGKVVFKGYDGGGYGNYLIINVAGEPHAEVYGHLKGKATVRDGANVKTGEKIGEVGQSGNAVGCHLHFEYWKGKYPDGHAVAGVTKHLKRWDSWS